MTSSYMFVCSTRAMLYSHLSIIYVISHNIEANLSVDLSGDSWNWISSSIWNDFNVLLQSHNRSKHWDHMVCWVLGNIYQVWMWLKITWGLIRCKFWLSRSGVAPGIFAFLTDSQVILIFLVHGPLWITRLYNMNWSR